MRLLVINPGSTSTKIGVFDGENQVFIKNIIHSAAELEKYEKISDQYDFRMNIIIDELNAQNIQINDFEAIVGRGGLVDFIESGTYEVNEKLLHDLKIGKQGQHASNLGGIIANEIAKKIGKKAYIVDPVVVDELCDIARLSGHPKFERRSIFHALNQKAIAKQYAFDINAEYENLNLIVVHMGGGVSVGIHEKGKVIDVNNALDGEGAFSPERSGTLPIGDVIEICFKGEFTKQEIKKMLVGKGGIVAYLGSNNTKELFENIDKDNNTKTVLDAMLYQISKDIGAMATVVDGKVDAILLTGGVAYSEYAVNYITNKVSYIAKIFVYPGEDELKALAQGFLRVYFNKEQAKIY